MLLRNILIMLLVVAETRQYSAIVGGSRIHYRQCHSCNNMELPAIFCPFPVWPSFYRYLNTILAKVHVPFNTRYLRYPKDISRLIKKYTMVTSYPLIYIFLFLNITHKLYLYDRFFFFKYLEIIYVILGSVEQAIAFGFMYGIKIKCY
jgi:hypothetical protein